jgi:cell fate regulator YaaT (PSP1 superfamily)
MACGSCGTGAPGGCGSKGSCGTGSCNRMNVHDWLMNLPFSDPESNCRIIEVSFNQGSRKDFYRNAPLQYFEKGELVTVEGVAGFDVGEVCLSGELVRLQLKKRGVNEDSTEIKKVLRRAGPMDIEKMRESKAREKDALIRSRAIARQLNLNMKIAEVEIQADGKKATFFYIADDRVDFRELIKVFATEFRVKVEMRQIGARQEAGKVGGIGSCGRELCCSTWLHDFKSVNTNAARYQNLSINQTKLSGQCGRLKCCLNYELDTYMDALQAFPHDAEVLEMARCRAMLVKKDIFKSLMWYTLPDSSRQYPLTIARVKEIKEQNRQGIKPEELQPVDLTGKNKEAAHEFVDLVGHISLKALEKTSRRNRDKERPQQPQRQHGGDRDNRSNQGGATPRPEREKPQQGANQRGQGGGNQPQRPLQNAGAPKQVQPRPQQNNQRPPQNAENKPQPKPAQQQRAQQPRPQQQSASEGGQQPPPQKGNQPNQQKHPQRGPRPPHQHRPPHVKGHQKPPEPKKED